MRIKEMIKAAQMKKYNFPVEMVDHAASIDVSGNMSLDCERLFVEKMDELLTEEQRLLLWEIGGACRGGETGRQAKALAQELADMPLSEKIDLMNKNEHMFKSHLNEDGTVTAECCCHCLQYRITKPERAKSPSAYGCSAGAALYNLKTALGIKAKLKSIDYPRDGDGKTHMAFTFEIV